MFKRKIYELMNQWKNSLSWNRKALVIKGLRQVGKTTIVKEFCRVNYENVVYINFKNSEAIKKVFNNDMDVDELIVGLSTYLPEAKFIPHKTVIVFDELQECSNARYSIKCFMEDPLKRYDIICSGSLLGLRGYNKAPSKGIPTGFEKILIMKPMDFEEFLWAKNIKVEVLDYIKDCFYNNKKIRDEISDRMHYYFKEYLCVGGMPSVVDLFLKTSDMNAVLDAQRQLLEEYKDDFGKHLNEKENEEIDKVELARIMEVFKSIPNQLAKENKKFQYSKIKTKGRGSDYREAIQWLIDAGLISQCFNLSNLESPLEGNKLDNIFKLYMRDSGLFIAMLEKGTAGEILSGNLGTYKGAIYENIIAD
ncbi:MAG: ATP-binding protein, partial [Bacilli bacterium]|nr:ATP-binding protein [Bacilli bacterium]